MGKQDDYVNQDGLQVDRGRIDRFRVLIKCHVHVGSPFLDLCVQNGSPRDGSSRWFTCGFVKGPHAPLSIFYFFFEMFDSHPHFDFVRSQLVELCLAEDGAPRTC